MADRMRNEPVEKRIHLGDLEMALFERPGAGPVVLFLHATGFHARCWDGVARELAGAHLIAVDLRGHGRSAKLGPYGWDVLARDIALLCDALQIEDCVGVGHSLGGHLITQTAAARPRSFRSLVLVDPVTLAPEIYANFPRPTERTAGNLVTKRQRHFDSPSAMYERFRSRLPFSAWKPEALSDYCEHGLQRGPAGKYDLACPPEVEAAVYAGTGSEDIHAALARIQIPVVVVRARSQLAGAASFDFSSSPTWPELAARFPNGRDVHYPELTHFIPMQAPEVVAEHVKHALAG